MRMLRKCVVLCKGPERKNGDASCVAVFRLSLGSLRSTAEQTATPTARTTRANVA
jgi:hypothetical protein